MRGPRRQTQEFRIDIEGQKVVGRLEVPVDVSLATAVRRPGSLLTCTIP